MNSNAMVLPCRIVRLTPSIVPPASGIHRSSDPGSAPSIAQQPASQATLSISGSAAFAVLAMKTVKRAAADSLASTGLSARSACSAFRSRPVCLTYPPPHTPTRTRDVRLALGAFDRRLTGRRGFQRGLDAEPNEVALRRRLEKREVLAVAPRERPAEPSAGRERRVVDRRDHGLVVGLALPHAREAAQVRARREHDVDAGHAGDLVGERDAGRRLDHRDDDHVVVRRLTILVAVERAVLAVAEA